MLMPFINLQPLSIGLRAGGRWLNWTKSTPSLPVWEIPFVAADHLQPCKPDPDFPEMQEATIDDHAIYTADSIALFVDGKPIDCVPIPPRLYGPDGPHSSLGDPGFEQVQIGAGQFLYRPAGSPWTFAGTAGISTNQSRFTSTSPVAPEGSQVAFLQANSSISQTISGWTIGTYLLTFWAAQRGTNRQDFTVLVDGVVVGTFLPPPGPWQRYATAPFAVAAGQHIISFQGLDTAGGDNTAFVDSVLQATVG